MNKSKVILILMGIVLVAILLFYFFYLNEKKKEILEDSENIEKELSNFSNCIIEWQRNTPHYDHFYIIFKENITKSEAEKLLASYGVGMDMISSNEEWPLAVYYVLVSGDAFKDYMDFLRGQNGVDEASQAFLFEAEYLPHILNYTDYEKIIRLKTEKGIDLNNFIYNFENITVNHIKRDKIIWGSIPPTENRDSEMFCSLKEDSRVLSIELSIPMSSF